MRTKHQIDMLRVLGEALAANPVYASLFEKTGKIIDEQIGEPLSQLASMRSSSHIKRGDYIKDDDNLYQRVAHVERVTSEDGTPLAQVTLQLGSGEVKTVIRRDLQDRATLIDQSKLLGMDYYSDYLKDEDLDRIVSYISSYWPKNGQPEFIKFIGFVKGLSLDAYPLWTRDKGDNANSDDEELSSYEQLEQRQSYMTPVWEQGDWYPTSHVEIEYDALLSTSVDDDLILLFYTLAPVHLVLERISGAINTEITYSLGAVVDLVQVDSGYIAL